MGPGFERIAERFCRAAIAVKERVAAAAAQRARSCCAGRGDGWTRRARGAVRDIDACVYEYLAAERQRDFAGAGLVKMLVDGSRAQGDEFDDRSLRDQILTVFFAGHETTATSLSWIHYLLDAASRRARASCAPRSSTCSPAALPTSADLDRLVYTEQVVNEALRLYSPIHSLSRVALEDDTLGGYDIPAGATIYVSLYATHRLPYVLAGSGPLRPRALHARTQVEQRPRFAFIPFAAGHRNCVGGSTAIVELKLAVAMIAQRYELDLAPGQRVEGAAGTTMHPRYGMNMLHPGTLGRHERAKTGRASTRHTRLLRSRRRHRSRSSPCSTTASAATPRTASSRPTSPSSTACGSTSTRCATRRVEGRDVLEVSCGRGGGANFVSRTFKPQRYVGVDLSQENIRLARERAARQGLTFAIGNAEQLDLADASFDVVINIEASHLYDDRDSVLRRSAARAEARRPLLLHGRLLGRRRLHRGPARRRVSSFSSASRSRATCCTRCAKTTRGARRCSTR